METKKGTPKIAAGLVKTPSELLVHHMEIELQNEKLCRARYFDLYDQAPVGYCPISGEGLILETNLAAANLLGTDRDALVNQPLTRFIIKEDQDIYSRHREQLLETHPTGTGRAVKPHSCELRMVKNDRTEFWARLVGTAVRDAGEEPVYRMVLSDITERKRAEEKLLQMATHDPGTGLANRTKCVEMLAQAVAMAKRYRYTGAVLYLDLNDFKQVNDAYGHDVGDQLLREVAVRLQSTTRVSDTVARLGGDEFAVVLTRIERGDHAGIMAQRIIDVLKRPVEVGGHDCSIGASIGISVFPSDSLLPEHLLKCADTAMYAVKQSGKEGFRFHQAP